MIRDRTVFILGAGSSCHYGYPTGEGLVDTIIEVASRLSTYCDNRIKSGQVVQIVPKYIEAKWRPQSGTRGAIAAWEEVRSECEDLVRRIKVVRPLIIDYFLAWNDSISGIGKLIIAAALAFSKPPDTLRSHICSATWSRSRCDCPPSQTLCRGLPACRRHPKVSG